MEEKTEELLRSKLEDGETVLWTGKAVPGKILSPVYRQDFLLKLVISGGIGLFFVIQCILSAVEAGEPLKIGPVLVIIGVAAVAPCAVLADGKRAGRLRYAATDRRLISLNGDNVNSVPYSSIHEAALKQDSDGNTSLLCGKTGVTLKEGRWRDIATLNCTSVSGNRECDRFVLYSIDDVDGLKAAVGGQLDI